MGPNSRSATAALRRRARLAVGLLGLLVLGALAVQQATGAAFRATAPDSGNRIAAGTVSIADDSAGTVLSVSGLQPGEGGARCVKVTYGGSLAAQIKLYATATSGLLRPYLDLVVEQGAGGSNASCAGFAATSVIFTGTLTALGTNHTDYASGLGSFLAPGANQSRVYRVRYTLSSAAPASVAGEAAGATLRWEARNT